MSYDFGDHEVTDRAALIFELASEKLLEHPKVQEDDQLLGLAETATEALYNLYQASGAKMAKKEKE